MINREKVIKGFEICLKNIDRQDCPNDCPYLSDCSKYENRVIFQPLMRDALALLRETNIRRDGRWKSIPHKKARVCSVCEADEPYKFADDDADVYAYCPFCGAKMEGR